MSVPLTSESILGPRGRIAERLKAYEQRPEQLQMAQAVARAIAEKKHLVVEAGTGVGKSFAYLVPAILAAASEQVDDAQRDAVRDDDEEEDEEDGDEKKKDGDEKKKRTRVVISTHTI